jgi:hypothetical protein
MVFLAQRVVIWPCDWLNYFSHRHDSFSLYYVIISNAANTTKNLNKNSKLFEISALFIFALSRLGAKIDFLARVNLFCQLCRKQKIR